MLSDEEKKEYEELKTLLYTGTISQYGKRKLIEIIEKQSKEIKELKDMNERQKYRIELVSEDEIEERGDSIDESTMLKQIKLKLQEKNIPIETLLAEFERLEDEEKKALEKIDYIQDFIIENGQYNADVNDMEYFSKVLNLIEKQSKEIEELKKYEEGYKLLSYSLDNYISKDKIKAKIEELDEQEKEKLKGTKGQDRYAIKQEYMYKRSGLQSLLEKE